MGKGKWCARLRCCPLKTDFLHSERVVRKHGRDEQLQAHTRVNGDGRSKRFDPGPASHPRLCGDVRRIYDETLDLREHGKL
jgi:hypothetical protein